MKKLGRRIFLLPPPPPPDSSLIVGTAGGGDDADVGRANPRLDPLNEGTRLARAAAAPSSNISVVASPA